MVLQMRFSHRKWHLAETIFRYSSRAEKMLSDSTLTWRRKKMTMQRKREKRRCVQKFKFSFSSGYRKNRDMEEDDGMSSSAEQSSAEQSSADIFSRWGFITDQLLERRDLPSFAVVPNGLVVDLLNYLSGFAQSQEKSKQDLADFLCELSGRKEDHPSPSTIWARAKAIGKKRTSLTKTKRESGIQALIAWENADSNVLGLVRDARSSQCLAPESVLAEQQDDEPVYQEVASKLAREVHVLEQQIEELKSQAVSHREFQNALRREKRKSATVFEQRATLKKIKKDVKDSEDVKADRRRWAKQAAYWQEKSVAVKRNVAEKADDFKMKSDCDISDLRSELKKLSDSNAVLEVEVENLRCELAAIKSLKVETVAGKSFTSDVRKCSMDLLSRNVGINNVEPIMRSVASLCGKTLGRLPQPSKLSMMYVEAASLSQVQLSEVLVSADNVTLHSDGTTKFGQKYLSFQVEYSLFALKARLCVIATAT